MTGLVKNLLSENFEIQQLKSMYKLLTKQIIINNKQ